MVNSSGSHRYDNMINIPHPKAAKPMSASNRAAQFSPFAALTGYDEKVKETARLTDDESELSESSLAALDRTLQYVNEHINDGIRINVTYFVPDNESHRNSKKSGGEYLSHSGIVKRIDTYDRKIIFTDFTEILLDRITDISSLEHLVK